MFVHADEFAFLLHVGDDVVDRHLRGGTGGRGNGDGRYGVVLRRSDAFERTDVLEFRIGDDDADGLRGVHGRAAADGDDGVRAAGFERRHTVLDVFNGRVRLDAGIDGIGDLSLVEQIGDLGGDAELHEIGVGADKDVLPSARGCEGWDLLDRSLAVIGDGIENDAVRHNRFLR